ncbi:MAG: hypothetical protein ACRDOX_06990 [Nocardioides sp.]
MATELRDLDAAALLDVSSEVVRRRRLAEVEGPAGAGPMGGDPLRRPDRRVPVQLGGEGTAGVQDFCLGGRAGAGHRRHGDHHCPG